MDRSKVVAVITGVISLGLAIAYLLLVQFLDSRGPMVPAPIDLGLLFSANGFGPMALELWLRGLS